MRRAAIIALWAISAFAQTRGNKPLLGTITGFQADPAAIQVQPDSGDPVLVKFGPDTLVGRVAPGAKDLSRAQAIPVTDLAAGDRVLVSFLAGMAEARRIVVMPAAAIEQRRAAERQDWMRRGIGGVVDSVKDNQIRLRARGLRPGAKPVVTVTENTIFRRYAPDSVRFADARPSSLAAVRPGDQLRARGQKSADGQTVAAEEIVFGTFLTKAGTATAVDAAGGEVTVKDAESNQPLVIKVTADSQVKRMPGFAAAARGGGPGDPNLMIERLPATSLSDLKPGEAVVVSCTRGAAKGQITAILLLGNAGPLVQMASRQSQTTHAARHGPGAGMGMEGMTGGLELPGILP